MTPKRDTSKPRTDPDLTAEWVDERIRPGLMIEEDDGTLRPIGMVEAWKTYSKWRQQKIDEERERENH